MTFTWTAFAHVADFFSPDCQTWTQTEAAVVFPPQRRSCSHEDSGLFRDPFLFVCLFLLWRPAPSAVLNSSPATNTETHTLTVHVTYCTMPRKAGGRDCGYKNKGNLCSFINRKINVYFYSYGLAISCLYLPPCHCFTLQRTCTTCHDFCKAVCCFLDHL